jgi:hypothetical protein
VLAHFQERRVPLAADPAATEHDRETLDAYIRWTEQKLGILSPEEQELRDERRRRQTRERVRKHRAHKAGERG